MNLLEDRDFLRFKGMQEQAYLVKYLDLVEKMKARSDFGAVRHGDTLPWDKTFDNFRMRPGEVTLWAGINGHGKSLVLGQVLLWLPSDSKNLIASLEMPADATAYRMCQQTVISGKPSPEYIEQFARECDNFWVYTELSTVHTDRILALVAYAGEELGVNHMMIDSLVKCGIRNDDFDMQKQFTDALCQLAKAYDMHIHLVHHMRKGDREGNRPDKFDVRGAGEITDLVDNVILVHRNKAKEFKVEQGKDVDELDPDQRLIVAKQRHGEWEGTINLYFDKHSTQFMSGPRSRLRWRSSIS